MVKINQHIGWDTSNSGADIVDMTKKIKEERGELPNLLRSDIPVQKKSKKKIYYGIIGEEKHYGGMDWSWRKWVEVYLTRKEQEYIFQKIKNYSEYRNLRKVIFEMKEKK